MPSVKLALDHVNEHDSVLRNYRLHMWWNDTEVSTKQIPKCHYISLWNRCNKGLTVRTLKYEDLVKLPGQRGECKTKLSRSMFWKVS